MWEDCGATSKRPGLHSLSSRRRLNPTPYCGVPLYPYTPTRPCHGPPYRWLFGSPGSVSGSALTASNAMSTAGSIALPPLQAPSYGARYARCSGVDNAAAVWRRVPRKMRRTPSHIIVDRGGAALYSRRARGRNQLARMCGGSWRRRRTRSYTRRRCGWCMRRRRRCCATRRVDVPAGQRRVQEVCGVVGIEAPCRRCELGFKGGAERTCSRSPRCSA